MRKKENESVKVEKVRKVFLDHLPRKTWKSINKYKIVIDWFASIGIKVKFIYDNIEGEVEIVGYKSKGQYLYIKYEDKDAFKIKTSDFKRCTLGNLLGKHTNEFKVGIGTILKDDKRDIIIIDRKHELKYRKDGGILKDKLYKYMCNKCGYDQGWVSEGSLIQQRTGCPVCCLTPQTVVEGINDITTTDPWMIPYFQGGYDEAKLYTCQSSQKINPICPDCGTIKNNGVMIYNIYRNKSIGCSKCGDGISYPNKFIFNVLKQLNIEFTTEYLPSWSKGRKYDFYFELNNEKYLIEAHGKQHYVESFKTCGGRTLEEEIENDRVKKELALSNCVKEENYIIIDCRQSELEWIKNNILKSRLNKLFYLSNINWNKVEEFALSNLVKLACELKKNNPDMTAGGIMKIMRLSKSTIIKYLKQGTKLGWIHYDPKDEMVKSGIKSSKMNGKPVEIFKDNISLGVFKSCAELERQSVELFGVRLEHSNISVICLGKKEFYKGFHFQYV